MRIIVLGAAGATGRRVVAEARRRGHEVTAAGRTAGPAIDQVVDGRDADALADAVRGHDALVVATRVNPKAAAEVPVLTRTAARVADGLGVRLVVVGGAAVLTVPGTGVLALDDPGWVPPAIRPIALASVSQWDALRDQPGDWVLLAPAALFAPVEDLPGGAVGGYRLTGGELPVIDGVSELAMEDMALAVVDQAVASTLCRELSGVGPAA
ncbi:NAD(P)-dependent oxidoreductase [Kytococcus sedentarius]|uniref:NAD(P)-dependent oxidoreductase n=1 Tax=Kytococcus sedentarius TaxID=1276 RepID=UPI0035BC0160